MNENVLLKTGQAYALTGEEKHFYMFFKRLLDVICSISAIILLSPLLIVTSILIKADSKGPVLFKQKRCGKDGKEFTMYKFRSMVVNAEDMLKDLLDKNEQTGPVFKIKEDPRVTRIGKFIRRTSIDELPQLFNILKGDMSIVGPRPPLPREVKQYDSYHRLRLSVKPGLTCYWQVMGRDSIGFDKWVELDIKYIMERSIWVDLSLIFKTFRVLFGDNNAS